MNKRIVTGHFDHSLLLRLGGSPQVKPVRILRIDKAWEFAVTQFIETTPADGLKIIAALNNLPFAGPMRCHIPAFGLELLLNETQVFACSICWQCNNVFILNQGERGGITFDGQSPEGQALLEWFKSAFSQTA